MNNELQVSNVEKKAIKQKRLQLAKVGGLVLSSIVLNNLNLDKYLFPQLISFYTVYEVINYLELKGKNDYIINEEKGKTLALRKGE